MLELREVTKSFGGFRALDGLTLTVPTGAVYGLVGPNGAGKTTAIRHMAGIYRQDGGEVLLDGQPVFEDPVQKAKIAWIPDDIYYFPQADLRTMARFYAGVSPGFDRALCERLTGEFGLDPRTPLRRFSRGMQKQAAFLLAISRRPELLLLDEPVDGLDPLMRRRVWGLLMAEVAERGLTVLVSSHNLRELEDVCDRVGLIRAGRTLLDRSLGELQENIVKVQIVREGELPLPAGSRILHESRSGRMRTLIVRADAETLRAALEAADPVYYDLLPLTLEEIFIYELGGAGDDLQEILS